MASLSRDSWSSRRTSARVLWGLVLGWCHSAFALNAALDVNQYAHTTWTAKDGLSTGAIFAMAQTPDGYLWLGSEFGLFRFDGVRVVLWQPPAGQQLPTAPYTLLVTRDRTLWIGTFAGLVAWNGAELTRYRELDGHFVTSLLEDRAGTVWAGTLGGPPSAPGGRLCAIRGGRTECYLQDGAFGSFVWSLGEDSSGALWVGADSGVWRWSPGPPKHYVTPGMRIGDLSETEDGRLLIGVRGAGLMQFAGDKLEAYPIPSATDPGEPFADRNVDSNKLLRDRDGGLWIGTFARGLIHVHRGRTDVFTKSDGLSGDISCSIFEDAEGNVWVATTGGLDRFRTLPVATVSRKQGLSSDSASSVIAATDGSIWVGTHDGLTRWKNGKTTIFRRASGLPDDVVQSLFYDYRERIWASTGHGLAYLSGERFVAVDGLPDEEVYSIAGDNRDNLWLSGNKGLSHLLAGRLVEHFPWSALGRQEHAVAILSDQAGIWLSFWGGGVSYWNGGQIRASYTAADGLGSGAVNGLEFDRDGALWAATSGGLSRIKEGRIATLTTRNGLPCDSVHLTIQDDDRALWLYTACGLVRIARTELNAWIADPKRRIETTMLDASDGVRLHPRRPAFYGPSVAKSGDGKLWFLMGEDDVQVVDPRHLSLNKLPPPVHIQQIVADRQIRWQNLPGKTVSNLRLPPQTRDLSFDYTALSFVQPEKVHFKYKLEGQDPDWREVINEREAQYSNIAPGSYRFRVLASNNSGVWNETGASLDFSIAPAYWQTAWFRALCVAAMLALLWVVYRLRMRQLAHEFDVKLEARVDERTRIARELHDTLLQSFNGLLLRFRTVHALFSKSPDEARTILENALDETRQALTEGRQAVQGLRSTAVETHEFSEAIQTLAEELANDPTHSGGAEVRLNIEGTVRTLRPPIRDEIYRIASEALRNAFRHAEAGRIEVQLSYDEKSFELRVRDDGKGIDPKFLTDEGPAGHFGLHGMRERAQQIGGQLTVWSAPASGTELVLSVPGALAYDTAENAKRSWLARALTARPRTPQS
jgi:signal transduction histidine kinase/ligand-binding sensor domain-containing protein